MNAPPTPLPWRTPEFPDAALNPSSTADGVQTWYHPVLLTAEMIGRRSMEAGCARKSLEVLRAISTDAYVETLRRYYQEGLERYGEAWRYSDIVTVLLAAAELLSPRSCLEIGVRRGRSLAAVARAAPACAFVGFDRWTPNYAGMENPGPESVRQELCRLGHTGPLELVSGNSHETVPAYFRAHPDAWFDLVTVDGDHSADGAARDLACVLPRLRIGGAVVFDDIAHPKHPDLRAVWDFYCGRTPRFSHWEYESLGYGVAVAVRKY